MRFPDVWILDNKRNRIFRAKTVYSDVVRWEENNYAKSSQWVVGIKLTVEGFDELYEEVNCMVLRVGPFDSKIFDEVCKVCKNVSTELFIRFLRYISSNYREDDIVDVDKVMSEVASPRFMEFVINKIRSDLNAKSIDATEIKITSPFLK